LSKSTCICTLAHGKRTEWLQHWMATSNNHWENRGRLRLEVGQA
jgi:hypothetical protein